jgi:hypothetical protein
VDERLSGSVDRIALARAMQELPAGYRTIFLLHEIKGYEHQEIARILRCSVGNSKSQLHKAKLKMRELLGYQKNEVEAVDANSERDVRDNADSDATMTADSRQEVSWDSVDDMLQKESVVFSLADTSSQVYAESGL